MTMAMRSDMDKLAMRMVAVDRQLAGAVKSALRAWARTKKATGARTSRSLLPPRLSRHWTIQR